MKATKRIAMVLAVGMLVGVGMSARADLVGYWSFDNPGNRYEESSGWAQAEREYGDTRVRQLQG